MTTYLITLPGGRKVTIGEYVRSWKVLKQMVKDGRGRARVAGWNWWDTEAADILRQIRRGVHDRINTGGHAARTI